MEGTKPNISYFHPFRCKCFILTIKDKLRKFDPKSDHEIFLGYSETSKAIRVYTSITLVVEEVIHIRFDGNKPDKDLSELDECFIDLQLIDSSIATSSPRQNPEKEVFTKQEVQEEVQEPIVRIMRRNHLESHIIRDPSNCVQTRSSLKSQRHIALISEMEPKHIDDAIQDDNWVKAMHEELDQFQENDVWKLVELPKGKKVVGMKHVFCNKLDENG